jgi:Flp pilus assembly protein TadD
LHGLKWVAVFVIPLGALWIGQTRTNMPEVEQQARMASDLPNSARAHWKYGFALQKADRLDEAAEQCRIALRLDPNEKEVHYHLGQVLVAQSQLSEGRSELEQALRSDPRNGEFHSEYGYALERLGQKDEAGAEYATATRLSPKSGVVHYDYAMFLLRGGKIDQSIPEFQTALKHSPNHPEAHYHLGRAFFVKGDLEGAKVHYLETARLDPKAPVHNGLGVVYMRLGQTSEAIAQFKEALRLRPDDADAAENLRFAVARGTQGGSTPR